MKTATKDQVRKLYKDQDHEVRIDRDGHVTFRKPADVAWKEGRWVSEYRVADDGSVYLQ